MNQQEQNQQIVKELKQLTGTLKALEDVKIIHVLHIYEDRKEVAVMLKDIQQTINA